MPVYNGKESWQLYHGEGFNAPVKYLFNEWMHVKLVLQEGQMEVYINDMNKPALFVPELKRAMRPGTISLGGGARRQFQLYPFRKAADDQRSQKSRPGSEGTIAPLAGIRRFSGRRIWKMCCNYRPARRTD